jgi:hypothetical protein
MRGKADRLGFKLLNQGLGVYDGYFSTPPDQKEKTVRSYAEVIPTASDGSAVPCLPHTGPDLFCNNRG